MTAAPVHILLVEDNPGDARLVQEALREAVEQAPAGPSYRVTVAGRLAAALEALDAGGFDVVLLDLELPDSRGLDTYLRVRARAPGCPIVTLTSNGDESLGVRMLREGAQDYLPKSRFDGESLVRSVRYAQERMAIERERERLIVLEQEARRQAEEASQLKDEFLTTISHELRTPLTAILGWARMLSRGEVPDERRAQALATIERNAQAQTQLIEDLLDMSRLIKGTFTLSAVPLEVAPVVEAALETVRPAARAKGLELLADLAPDAVVRGDAGRLQQVVWNLLSNAVKFTPSGGRVHVSVRRLGAMVELTVADTGRGITPDFQAHAFERFRQADGTITRRQGGLGLGLSLVQKLVELHGGTVSVASEGEGQGATFTVRLPLLVAEPREREAPVSPPVARATGPTPAVRELADLRVLVVEDDEDARALLVFLLESRGARVEQADSAEEGRRLFEAAPPDLVVSDIGLPGENGYDFVASLRRRPPAQGGAVPAIALTAYAHAEDQAHALAAGFDRHLPKPIEPQVLVEAVASLAHRVPPAA